MTLRRTPEDQDSDDAGYRFGLDVDYVELYVEDLQARTAEWTGMYGFLPVADAGSAEAGYLSRALRHGSITLVLTQGLASDHPASVYVAAHGDGVADIALRTSNVFRTFEEAVARGAVPVRPPVPNQDPDGPVATATVVGFGDCMHTLVQRREGDTLGLPVGFPAPALAAADLSGFPSDSAMLRVIDHFAVLVEYGELDSSIAYYRDALGLHEIFEERIVVGSQVMNSKVVQNAAATLTFTIIEPDTAAAPGQIDDFLAAHGGAGVQHIAFTTGDAVESVRLLSARGVEFLTTPSAYYELLASRIDVRKHALPALEKLGILVDQDHDGQLFQIFTRSTHPRRTLFFELIERMGARTFGASNIKSLYEAVEVERLRRRD